VSDTYLGTRIPGDTGDLLTAIHFIARQVQEQGWTATIVQVLAVYGGGLNPPGTVDVQPMVAMLNGLNQPTPHSTVRKLPFGRIQFGESAIVCDPKVGDVGLAVFASHDISAAVASGQPSNPGSRRRFSPNDGIYVISLIGKQPTTFVQFLPDGEIQITVPSGKPLNLQADTVAITGNLTVSGSIVADDDVTAGGSGGVSLETHVHSGVQSGSSDTGPPT